MSDPKVMLTSLQMITESNEIGDLVKDDGLTPENAPEVVRRSVELRSLALEMETKARGMSRMQRVKREDGNG